MSEEKAGPRIPDLRTVLDSLDRNSLREELQKGTFHVQLYAKDFDELDLEDHAQLTEYAQDALIRGAKLEDEEWAVTGVTRPKKDTKDGNYVYYAEVNLGKGISAKIRLSIYKDKTIKK